MNREILFRGKRKDNDEWIYGLYTIIMVREKEISKKLNGICFVSADAICDMTAGFNGKTYEVIPKTISQYTGLKDKNGVKIFEGDIMKQHRMNGNENAGNLYKTIKWKNTFNYSGFNITKQGCKNWEVIGNIYDNKELLEKEDK